MNPEAGPQSLNSVTEEMQNEAGDYAKRFTVAFLQERGKERRVYATGILLKIYDRRFVVTCGHVVTGLAEGVRESEPLCASAATGELLRIRSLRSHFVDDETGDVGYFEVPLELAHLFGDPGSYLELDDLAPGRVHSEGQVHLVCGFPKDLFVPDISRMGLLRHLSTSKPTLCEGDYNPEVEIILGFNPDPQGPTWRGKKPGEVTPFGMSGGGVWRFPSLGSAGSWKPSDIRVVGLQSVWNETKKFLRVTRIARLLRLIADEDTDLSKLIQQHLSRE